MGGMSNTQTDVLVIPDAHVAPGQDLSRFKAVGKLAADLYIQALEKGRDFVVITMGDFGDFESLSNHSDGTKASMDKVYLKDIEACNKALDLFHEGLGGLPARLVALEGNHEGPRLSRILATNPRYEGMMDPMKDIGWADRGWEVYPFKFKFAVDQVYFSHYFTSGTMDKAIGGINMARNMLLKQSISCVAGHSHVLDHSTLVRGDGARLTALSTGVFCSNDDDIFKWNGSAYNYWAGLVILRRIEGTDFDTEFLRLESLMAEYSA